MSNTATVVEAGRFAGPALAFLRISTALIFLQHGLQKVASFPVPPVPGYQHLSLAGVAGLLEVLAAPMLVLGWHTRPVAFVMSGLMAVAYFMGHAYGRSVFPLANGGDVAVLCCFIFLYLAATGGGAWTLDEWLVGRRARVSALV